MNDLSEDVYPVITGLLARGEFSAIHECSGLKSDSLMVNAMDAPLQHRSLGLNNVTLGRSSVRGSCFAK
jgi:hypothetical protein